MAINCLRFVAGSTVNRPLQLGQCLYDLKLILLEIYFPDITELQDGQFDIVAINQFPLSANCGHFEFCKVLQAFNARLREYLRSTIGFGQFSPKVTPAS